MAFLRAGIFGNLQLLGRYFYSIAQTALEGNTQAAEKNPSGKHRKVEKVVKTPRSKGACSEAIPIRRGVSLTGRFSRKYTCCNSWVKC